jgi:hypothetical protein
MNLLHVGSEVIGRKENRHVDQVIREVIRVKLHLNNMN